ncbi:helix-turn-helix domain-containing protein [uncultured Bacteroides sp.]|uniref:winged helix-turn-helix transcriptional regulator n=1 Tax=uncultured Bacteroides sp. TaxID=162156 RepID=UPI00261A4D71|nr:helix-turn-helix domain-containing protein [uncultured Bacteroides sp.]
MQNNEIDIEKLKEDIFIQRCPIRNILSRISDKWSLLVIFILEHKPVMRFGELQRTIPDISQKMLTVTLRTLEQDGLIARKVYAQIPPKVEYSLTDRGKTLLPHLNGLIAWAGEQMGNILEDRRKNSANPDF